MTTTRLPQAAPAGGAYPRGIRFVGLQTGRSRPSPAPKRSTGGFITSAKEARRRIQAEQAAAGKARRAAAAKAAAERALAASRCLQFPNLSAYTTWLRAIAL